MRSAVLVDICGGLGNQMFQYAFGRALSIRWDADLLLRVDSYLHDIRHNGFELNRIFALPARCATANDLKSIMGWRRFNSIQSVIFKHPRLGGAGWMQEGVSDAWRGKCRPARSMYVHGYWQSEKYFAGYADVIRRDFTFPSLGPGPNAVVADRIRTGASVSLHIRHGDYASDPATQAALGVCPMEYYKEAVKRIAAEIVDAEYHIFSDDMEWARKNFAWLPNHVLVDNNHGADSCWDMYLMSICRHNIIANSSFSWWGAWLNPQPDKRVIAPKRWFVNPALQAQSEELAPKTWIRI